MKQRKGSSHTNFQTEKKRIEKKESKGCNTMHRRGVQ